MGKVEWGLWGDSWSCAGQKSPSFQLAREQAHQGERMMLCLGLFTGFWDSKDKFSSWAGSVISAICSCLATYEGPCHYLELLQGCSDVDATQCSLQAWSREQPTLQGDEFVFPALDWLTSDMSCSTRSWQKYIHGAHELLFSNEDAF